MDNNLFERNIDLDIHICDINAIPVLISDYSSLYEIKEYIRCIYKLPPDWFEILLDYIANDVKFTTLVKKYKFRKIQLKYMNAEEFLALNLHNVKKTKMHKFNFEIFTKLIKYLDIKSIGEIIDIHNRFYSRSHTPKNICLDLSTILK
ncbi:MAG: hypothetical protein PHW82_16810 [Bacteroidales bacterium]|nr:hypothetical protein [Bacteroidales bacterium]